VTDSAIVALRATVRACEAVQAGYAVIGAVARNAWAPPRATTDLDIAVFVTVDVYESLIRELAAYGFEPQQAVTATPDDVLPDVVLLRRSTGTVRRLDLLVAKSAFEMEAIDQAVVVDIGIPCRVVRPEHLIVYKLIAGRPAIWATRRTLQEPDKSPGTPSTFRWCASGRWSGGSRSAWSNSSQSSPEENPDGCHLYSGGITMRGRPAVRAWLAAAIAAEGSLISRRLREEEGGIGPPIGTGRRA